MIMERDAWRFRDFEYSHPWDWNHVVSFKRKCKCCQCAKDLPPAAVPDGIWGLEGGKDGASKQEIEKAITAAKQSTEESVDDDRDWEWDWGKQEWKFVAKQQ